MRNSVEMSDLNDLQINSIEAADFLKTLANSNRLIILSRLLGKEMCVGDLEKDLDISQSALSQHLGRMRAEGIVATRRESQQIFYRIKDARVARMLRLTYDLFYLENQNEAQDTSSSASVIIFPQACVGCEQMA
ncbi:MAG: metalloregulator ArsR/SmtB family transcription factor [Emcibacter sp.]|nr:metalloregulator ArsR/SmtB family transcription factor [Emcibacter sp.]